jgi:hypothetical protein
MPVFQVTLTPGPSAALPSEAASGPVELSKPPTWTSAGGSWKAPARGAPGAAVTSAASGSGRAAPAMG